VIRAKKLRIQEFRGIRDLTLDFGGKNFAICGPNGTGKSGIVDALEFVLTGNISRLVGAGTGGLSVKEHGPHVDSRNKPDKAVVTLTVDVPSLQKEVTITRSVREAKKPKVVPDTPEVRAVLERVALHPEFTLSRRELIRYVLAEPGKRAKEVQELLRLDEVESVRALLQKIANASEREANTIAEMRDSAAAALRGALVLTKLSAADIVTAANEKRAMLSLPPVPALEANTSIKDGVVSAAAAVPTARVAKAHAKADIAQIRERLDSLSSAEFSSVVADAVAASSDLTKDEHFLQTASREALLRSALEAFDNQQCPVCDTPWKPEDFRNQLSQKLERFTAVSEQRKVAEQKTRPILTKLESLRSSLASAPRLGTDLQPAIDTTELSKYQDRLAQLAGTMERFLPLTDTIAALSELDKIPTPAITVLDRLETAVASLPEPSQQDAARDFLSVGQEKLEAYRQAQLKLRAAQQRAATARHVADTYGRVTTEALEGIYKNVEAFFSKLYRQINHDDEEAFQAHLRPSIGKLGFDVDFYGRGFFPPGAYHSEGHQDGMGLCLYLALMNHLAGSAFTFAVLDDVLMSVDSAHRREVSKMLREQFPHTQFILTTHDEIWLRHMKTVGLLEQKKYAHFRTWDVSVGPTEWDDRDVWDEIDASLKRNDVRAAAALLRNYLEHFGKEACQELRAQVEFKGDAQYSLGDLLPPAIGKMKKYLKTAKAVAQSWDKVDAVKDITAQEDTFTALVDASQVDQWQVNAAVHYNEWANLTKNDFAPVVDAYRKLVAGFMCKHCNSVLYGTPPFGEVQSLRCACGEHSMNLVKKPQRVAAA